MTPSTPRKSPIPWALPILLWCCPAFAAPPAPIDALRDEASALVHIQQVLSWYTRTVGEPAIQAETYKGHGALLSRESIQAVSAAQHKAADPDKKRALSFFKSYLAGEFLGQKLAHFDDEVENAELAAQVPLSFAPPPGKVPYKQLDLLAGSEKDAGRRAEIESARARVWQQSLNPLLEKKEAEAQRLARSLGYRSYVELAQEFRQVDLKSLIAEGERFRLASDTTYAELLADIAQKELGMKAADLHRSDLNRLRKAPRFEKFFPKDLLIPAFRHLLAGIGLSLDTAAGTQIHIDDATNPLKEPRAACFSIAVPGDVRITVKPTGGVDDIVTFFHEGGHALHYANTTSKVWEFQQLGPYALTEGLAETFGHVWDDPQWLRRYRAFVSAWNRDHKTGFPVMTDADIGELVRVRVFEELYFLRRYASAKLIYEAALHGGDPALWREVYTKPAGDLPALYRDLFSRAYGFPLGEQDALRFRTDVDDLFYAADYTRAFGLANLIHEGLRDKFGADWYGNPAVGPFLRQQLFANGNRLQADEVAQIFGKDHLDFRPTEQRLGRLLRERAGQ